MAIRHSFADMWKFTTRVLL